jgi:hypothetical protein
VLYGKFRSAITSFFDKQATLPDFVPNYKTSVFDKRLQLFLGKSYRD